MPDVKDTNRAHVHIGYDGTVHKTFRGHEAAERFANEVRILRHLEAKGCDFVPRLLDSDADKLQIVTTSCGTRVDHISDDKLKSLFAELEQFGVRHDDPYPRNITYRIADGRFCVIDFELSTLLGNARPADAPPTGPHAN
ncbi:MAG: serine/threonine protein phosphatase [Opitutaceae bacterium]|nr:serine/threonine protein phosphatase [Opitutaceae bacterium]